MKKILVMFALVILVSQVYGLSASIGNAKMILYPEVKSGEQTVISRTILVRNVNNVSVQIEMTPYGDLEDNTRVSQSEFTLGPFEERDVPFNITISQPGRYEGNIAVGFKPIQNTSESSGVGLLSKIIIIAEDPTVEEIPEQDPTNQSQPPEQANPWIGAGVVFVILMIGIAFFVMMRRK